MNRLALLIAFSAAAFGAEKPLLETRLVFPLEKWHNHSSSVVELRGGELMVCWYHGSGERTADDVVVEAARLPRGAKEWSRRFQLADTPNFPDTNPILFTDSRARLWLMWPAIIANRWETAILKYRIASDTRNLKWDISDNVFFIPPNFEARVKAAAAPLLEKASGREAAYVKRVIELAGDKFASRIGWMPRTHPLELPSGRVLVPLYSDGYSFSIIAITDDGGATWTASEPIIGPGAVQPSLVRKKDGSIVAYMRDNGPAPKRVMTSESKDNGQTWSPAVDTDILNSGTSVEAIALRDGAWLMVNNDTEKGRNALAVTLSDDEGRTWKWKRYLEREDTGSFHYPSVIQARDGSIHVTYSYFVSGGKSVKHARFNTAWVKQ